jgi:hypothetical protein
MAEKKTTTTDVCLRLDRIISQLEYIIKNCSVIRSEEKPLPA